MSGRKTGRIVELERPPAGKIWRATLDTGSRVYVHEDDVATIRAVWPELPSAPLIFATGRLDRVEDWTLADGSPEPPERTEQRDDPQPLEESFQPMRAATTHDEVGRELLVSNYGLLPLFGFAAGVAILLFLWSPSEVAEWFVAAFIPGGIAYTTSRVPEGMYPPPISRLAMGLWGALFWLPLGVFVLTALGVVACVPESGGICS
jgi:hypothetical protein